MSKNEKFLRILHKGVLPKIAKFMKANNILPNNFSDSKGNTIFHIAILNSNHSLITFLVDSIRAEFKENSSEVLRTCMNSKNNDGFLPIHYAAFRGYVVKAMQKILQALIEMGSDLNAKTNGGLSLIHMAAQGDQPLILAILKEYQVKIDEKDMKGSTPLHWACYMGCETAASVLLSWKVPLNDPDEDGQTPLHLAAIAGNSRIIKNLLLKGSDRSKKDKDNLTAEELAVKNLHQDLVKILKKPSFFAECGVKPPLRPANRTNSFLFMFILLYSLQIVLTIEHIYTEKVFFLIYLAIVLLSLMFFVGLTRKDPGYVKKSEQVSLVQLYERFESHLICPDCMVKRPKRSRHCQICDKCVEKFDHHCPWINTCIGGSNVGLFFSFIIIILLSLSLSSIVYFWALKENQQFFKIISLQNITEGAFWVVVACSSAVFNVLIGGLVYVHFINFMSNKTTNERFSVVDHGNTQNAEKKPSYSLSNFAKMCFNADKDLDEEEKYFEKNPEFNNVLIELCDKSEKCEIEILLPD